MYLMEHVLECRVVVILVRSGGHVGEERRRVQKLVDVMGLGLITCRDGEDVSSVHTLLRGVVMRKRKKERNRDGRKTVK